MGQVQGELEPSPTWPQRLDLERRVKDRWRESGNSTNCPEDTDHDRNRGPKDGGAYRTCIVAARVTGTDHVEGTAALKARTGRDTGISSGLKPSTLNHLGQHIVGRCGPSEQRLGSPTVQSVDAPDLFCLLRRGRGRALEPLRLRAKKETWIRSNRPRAGA
ncbi:unnamed protein product [Arctogadus glacialis]